MPFQKRFRYIVSHVLILDNLVRIRKLKYYYRHILYIYFPPLKLGFFFPPLRKLSFYIRFINKTINSISGNHVLDLL